MAKLMRRGHQLELHDLPVSLWRLVTMVTCVVVMTTQVCTIRGYNKEMVGLP